MLLSSEQKRLLFIDDIYLQIRNYLYMMLLLKAMCTLPKKIGNLTSFNRLNS